MTSIYQRQASNLTHFETEQISSLLKRHYPNADAQYIEDRISVHGDFDIVFLKIEDRIVGVSYFKVNKLTPPFSKKKVAVIHFGQVIKSPEYQGNVIWKLGHWYATRNIGYLYPLKRVVGITISSNPKVYGHFAKLFPTNFAQGEADSNMRIFLNEYISNHTNVTAEVNQNYTMKYPNLNEKDISQDWEHFYRSKNEEANELFKRKEVITLGENGKISQTLQRLVCVGYRDAFKRFRISNRK